MTREQYFDALLQRGRPRLKVFCKRLSGRTPAEPTHRLVQAETRGSFSLNVGGTTKYAVHTLVP